MHMQYVPSIRACGAIRSLVTENSDNSAQLGAAGACATVANCLRAHMSTPRVVESLLGAIFSLSDFHDNMAKFLAAAALKAVARALTAHSSEDTLVKSGCKAVNAFVSGGSYYQTRLGDAGVYEAVIATLRARSCLCDLCDDLCNLCTYTSTCILNTIRTLAEGDNESKAKLIAAGAVSALHAAAAARSDEVKESAKAALKLLPQVGGGGVHGLPPRKDLPTRPATISKQPPAVADEENTKNLSASFLP